MSLITLDNFINFNGDGNTKEIKDLIRMLLENNINILITGESNTGKTTLLNAIAVEDNKIINKLSKELLFVDNLDTTEDLDHLVGWGMLNKYKIIYVVQSNTFRGSINRINIISKDSKIIPNSMLINSYVLGIPAINIHLKRYYNGVIALERIDQILVESGKSYLGTVLNSDFRINSLYEYDEYNKSYVKINDLKQI